MPASSYADVSEGGSDIGRAHEREAFDHGLALMAAANGQPGISTEGREAVRYMQQLWRYLIRDLADPANDLSDQLRGNLISIGLWVIRETDAIICGRKNDWTALIEINKTVREGLAK